MEPRFKSDRFLIVRIVAAFWLCSFTDIFIGKTLSYLYLPDMAHGAVNRIEINATIFSGWMEACFIFIVCIFIYATCH